jgi:hypothetical protein
LPLEPKQLGFGSGNFDLNEKSERRKKRDESKYIYVITHVFLAEFVKNKTFTKKTNPKQGSNLKHHTFA